MLVASSAPDICAYLRPPVGPVRRTSLEEVDVAGLSVLRLGQVILGWSGFWNFCGISKHFIIVETRENIVVMDCLDEGPLVLVEVLVVTGLVSVGRQCL